MLANNTIDRANEGLAYKAKEYVRLLKLRLSSLVVFSAGAAYLTAADTVNWTVLVWLLIGGVLVTGASNGFNQILEVETDKLMARTANRPLPIGSINPVEAFVFCMLLAVGGIAILWLKVNALSGILGLLSVFLYVAAYTPMKKVSPIAVFIGAFPGALPTMIGWVAYTNSIDIGAWTLFAIQFIWQFPHFWAIAWILNDDYTKAGLKMLPSGGGRTPHSALQMLIYAMFLIPMGVLPYYFGIAGLTSAIIAVVAAIGFSYMAYRMLKDLSIPAARKLMFASIIYLPIIQLAYLFDRL